MGKKGDLSEGKKSKILKELFLGRNTEPFCNSTLLYSIPIGSKLPTKAATSKKTLRNLFNPFSYIFMTPLESHP